MSNHEIWIPGVPATSATSGERPWKERVVHHAANAEENKHLRLSFQLTAGGNGHTEELTGLCEPVFSSLFNKLGWYGGQRIQLQSWSAERSTANPSGLRLIAGQAHPTESMEEQFGEPLIDFLFTGTIPQKSTDPYLAELLKKLHVRVPSGNDTRYAIRLHYGGTKIQIGDMTAGPVKAVIDSLYPILGGEAGQPESWRIDHAEVVKGVSGVKENTIRIAIWTIDEGREAP